MVQSFEGWELKEEALKNKAIMDGMIDEDGESSNKGWKRWDDFDNTNHDNEESTMFLNMDQLEKQLDNEEFQEIGSMAAFKIPEFHDTLIQHMESIKKSIDKRTLHKREYDNWVNERQMQITEENIDMSKALDASDGLIKLNGSLQPIKDDSQDV
ncbi:hypothetical protein Tco_1465566 [Tanacetum coccineum]